MKATLVVGLLLALAPIAGSLENGLARTPPMGWMSWTKFYCELDCSHKPYSCINEQLYQAQADALVQQGYAAVGYEYVHIDDCWTEKKGRENGTDRLVADHDRFPSGIPALADYMHSRGLKLGIYGDYGTLTCGGYPGTYKYEKIDAYTFAEWRVDYVKLDGCYQEVDRFNKGYPLFGDYLNRTDEKLFAGRSIVYSCSWPAYLIDTPDKVNYTEIGVACNLWRNYDDIADRWSSLIDIIHYFVKWQDKHIPAHGPGAWFDPDMLIIGDSLTEGEARVQMAVWCVWSAPLIMSNDLRTVTSEFRAILQNRAAIAIDQDAKGIMGRMVYDTGSLYYFVKQMLPRDGYQHSYAIAIVNYGDSILEASFVLANIGLTAKQGYDLRCVWCGASLGHHSPKDTYKKHVNGHDALFIKATIVQELDSFMLYKLRKKMATGEAF